MGRAASLNAAAMIHITEVVGNNASITSPEKSQQTNSTLFDQNDKPNTQKKKLSPVKKEVDEDKHVKKGATESSKQTKSQIQGKAKQKKTEIQSESSDSDDSDDPVSEEISVKATRAQTNKTAME